MKRAVEQMGLSAPPRRCSSSTRSTASTARAARGPTRTRTTGTPPSSARTAPRRSPRRRPRAPGRPGLLRPARPRRAGASRPSYWLGQQGRITEPMVLRARRHALRADPLGRRVHAWSPTAQRPRTARRGGLLHLRPDVQRGRLRLPALRPRVRHQQPARLLQHVPRVDLVRARGGRSASARRSVTLEDIHDAELIVIMGQNPGTNHPRMLTALEKAKKNGAKILAVNPLKEAGFVRFRNPQNAARRQRCRHRAGRPAPAGPGQRRPRAAPGDRLAAAASGAASTATSWSGTPSGFDEWAAHVARGRLGRRRAGHRPRPRRRSSEAAADVPRLLGRPCICWAMGITQHRNAVATIKEFVNVALLQGNIGKPGAGLCPVRGHSNVQGDRTMGIWERPPEHFLDALQKEFGFDPPREHGLDTVEVDPGAARRRGQGVLRPGRQLRRGRARHRRHRGRRCAAPSSPCTSRPS